MACTRPDTLGFLWFFAETPKTVQQMRHESKERAGVGRGQATDPVGLDALSS